MKLLIVDDEPPARERLRRLLAEIEDCEVVAEAGNGEEALSRCGELRPDVVLLDVRMPGPVRHPDRAPHRHAGRSAGGDLHDRLRSVRRRSLRDRGRRLPAQARAQGKARACVAARGAHFAEPAGEGRGVGAHRASARPDLRAARRAAAAHSDRRHLLFPRRPEVRDGEAPRRREPDRRVAENARRRNSRRTSCASIATR